MSIRDCRVADGRFVSREMDNGNSSKFVDLGDLEDLGTWKDLEGLGRTWGVVGGLRGLGGRGEISPGRFWCDPRNFAQVEQAVDPAKIFPTHARGLDFGPRSTHAILRGSRIVRKCQGRADLGWERDFFDIRNVAWVEQNLAPARFGSTLAPGQVWLRTDVGLGPNFGPQHQ